MGVWAFGTEIGDVNIWGVRFRVEWRLGNGPGFGDRYGGVLGQKSEILIL